MNATIELIMMCASLGMTVAILYFVYGFRKERAIGYLIGVVVCRIAYSSGTILEKSNDLLAAKLVFRHLQSTALNLMVPFFLLFVYQLIGREKLLKARWKVLLFAFFALWSLLSWFDSDLHVIYRMIELDNGYLVTQRSIYSVVFSLACYSTLAVCFYFLFHYLRNIRGDFRRPGMWVLFLSTLPVVLEIAKLAYPAGASWLHPLSVYCSFTGMLMLAIMLRIKFFSTAPIARNIVLDNIQESILIANASGKIIDRNMQALQWFAQMGHAAIDGRNTAELLEPWPEWLKLCKSMQQGRVEIETRLAGERKVYSVNVYPLRVLRKQGQGSISLIVDITEKERHLEQIAELNRLKDQLISIVSHDIRSPLAMHYQLVELLEDDRDRLEPDLRDIVDQMGEQARNTLGTTTNLLEWFRGQGEDMVLREESVELAEVVEECCLLLRPSSEGKRIEVSQTVVPGLRVHADREALGLILRNLLTNAIKFTEPGGAVQVDAQTSGDEVVVSVRDNGVGMEEERIRQLFAEKRLNSSPGTRGEKGTGLGLLVSRQFIERSGGTLRAESRVGQGSVFYFTMRGGAE